MQIQRTEVTGLAAEVRFNFGQRGKAKPRQAGNLADLDFVHVMVAAQKQQPDLRLDELARLVAFVSGEDQRFHSGLQRYA